jgi:ATP-binding dynein motor region
MTMRRGQNLVVKIGDNEVDYDRNFRLYLQTKLANPHYKPEINAQVQLVLCMLLHSLQRVRCCAEVCQVLGVHCHTIQTHGWTHVHLCRQR